MTTVMGIAGGYDNEMFEEQRRRMAAIDDSNLREKALMAALTVHKDGASAASLLADAEQFLAFLRPVLAVEPDDNATRN